MAIKTIVIKCDDPVMQSMYAGKRFNRIPTQYADGVIRKGYIMALNGRTYILRVEGKRATVKAYSQSLNEISIALIDKVLPEALPGQVTLELTDGESVRARDIHRFFENTK